MGESSPDWEIALAEALTRRVELRRQKWQIKSLELQLKAAQSLTNPQLNFVSGYQVNAFGDKLLSRQEDDVAGTPQGLNSAFETLTQGNQTTWSMGFQFSMPLGFRSAKAQVRNLELRLLKARQVLAAQELEISHELAVAFQNLAVNYANMKANYERIKATREQVRIVEDQYSRGLTVGPQKLPITADIVLRAQTSRAQAESAFYSSRVAYDLAITEIELRKGSLLEYHNIFLAEGEWSPQAYEQALRRARGRSAALANERLLHSEPRNFAYPRPTQPIPAMPGKPSTDLETAPPADPKLKVPPQPKESDPKSAGNDAAIQRTGYNGSRPRATSATNVPAFGELDDYQGGAIAPRTSR
jgi:hypothetical protein